MLRNYAFTGMALLLGLSLTAMTGYSLRTSESIRVQQRLEVGARRVRDVIMTQIKSVTDDARAIGWQLMAQKNANEQEFKTFGREVLGSNPALFQLQWYTWDRAAKTDGTTEPQLRPQYVVSESPASVSTTNWTLTPAGRNLLQISRDTGAVVTTPVTSNLELFNGFPGMNICFPVYRRDKIYRPTQLMTVEERREQLMGFVIGWVDLSVLMLPAIEEAERLGINFELFDSETSKSGPIFRSLGDTPVSKTLPFEVNLVVEMPIRRWEIRFAPDKGFLSSTDYRVSRAAIAVGCIITFLVSFLLHRQLRSQRAVERAQKLLRGITDNLPIGVFQYRIEDGTKSNFHFVSQSAHYILGTPDPTEVESRSNILNNVFPEDRSRLEPKLREACIAGEPFIDEFRITVKGEVRWLQIGATPFHADREVTALNGYWQDVTEKKAQEQALVEAKNRAEAATYAKSAFLANMSHELRTPLNAILGYAQILRRAKTLTERQVFGLETIQKSGQHLLALIDDLLDLAKIEAGKFKLYPAPIDLPSFLHGITDIISERADQKDLSFVYEIRPDLPSTITVDEQRLRQILLNLLGNAVKFTDKGEVRLEVQYLIRNESTATLRFEVGDTGVGMTAEQATTIFQPFEQVGETHRRTAGTGLGLSISRHLTRLMGGEIYVRTEAGKGTVFWFELTLPVDANAIKVDPVKKVVMGYEGPKRTVLVVDDIAANRSLLSDLLGMLGFAIREADNGQAALMQLKSLRPDAVLMDVRMPVMNGLETIRHIRATPGLEKLPIFAVSASATREDESQSFAAGADAFLAKPIDERRLFETMEKHLNLTWIHEEAK